MTAQMPEKPKAVVKSQEDLIRDAYEQWISHPTTQMFIKNLRKHREKLLGALLAGQGNVEIMNRHCSSLKTMECVLTIATDYDKFLQLVNNKLPID